MNDSSFFITSGTTLWRALLVRTHLSIFQNACFQPASDQADQTRVSHPWRPVEQGGDPNSLRQEPPPRPLKLGPRARRAAPSRCRPRPRRTGRRASRRSPRRGRPAVPLGARSRRARSGARRGRSPRLRAARAASTDLGVGFSVIMAAIVRSVPAIEAAWVRALLVTRTGSTMPSFKRFQLEKPLNRLFE